MNGPEMLKALRHDSGLTQESLARMSGLHVRTIRGLESGHITRPRRSSMDLIASALALDPGRYLILLTLWGIPDLDSPAPAPAQSAGGERMGAAETILGRSATVFRILALNELAVIGPDGRVSRRTTQEVAVAMADGATARYVFYDASEDDVDIDRLHLTDLENCSVAHEKIDPDGPGKTFELKLPKPLSRGETQILHYSADFAAARDGSSVPARTAGEEIAGFLHSPASYVLEVRFDGPDRPRECMQVFQPRPTGPLHEVAELVPTSAHSVHLALINPKPGGHGIAWR